MTTNGPPSAPGRTASRRNRPVPLVIGILLALVGFPHLIVLGVHAGTWQFGDAHGFQLAAGGLIDALTLAAGLLSLRHSEVK